MLTKMKSFRLHTSTIDKIDILAEMELQNAEKYKTSPKNKTEIVEDAIAEYYMLKLDKEAGSDYLSRMSLMIQDAMKKQNNLSNESLNKLLQQNLMAYEGVITILKYLRLDPSNVPKSEEDVYDFVRNSESVFEDPIKEKIEDLLHGNIHK